VREDMSYGRCHAIQGEAPRWGAKAKERGELTLTTGTPGVGQVHATQEQLNAMAQRCEDTGERLANGMAQLLNRITALSGSGMAGSANNALQGVSADLNNGLTKVLNALDTLAGKISSASTEYGVQDQDAARDIQQAAELTGNSVVINALRG
jgi:WXG100 family type VII secretion target